MDIGRTFGLELLFNASPLAYRLSRPILPSPPLFAQVVFRFDMPFFMEGCFFFLVFNRFEPRSIAYHVFGDINVLAVNNYVDQPQLVAHLNNFIAERVIGEQRYYYFRKDMTKPWLPYAGVLGVASFTRT